MVELVGSREAIRDLASRHSLNNRKAFLGPSKIELLLDKILTDFQLLNPKEKTCSFTHVKKELADKYDFKTRSISNFFHSQLENYKLIGGNRNRAIVMRKAK